MLAWVNEVFYKTVLSRQETQIDVKKDTGGVCECDMDEVAQYESLPPTSTVSTHMWAGAAAGIMEHSIMYPVDCVKVRKVVGNHHLFCS